ncbi:hypothetical protein BJV78DRAFT_753900 [Lactifluus subvellereus]|nr:hypothetical protein BJV78DRAFT_753900 [Lactifluus subvellereus]
MWSTDEGPMTQRPGYPALYGGGVPVTRHPSDSLPRMAFNSSALAASHVPLNSTLPGSGSFAPGTVMANEEPIYGIEHIHADINWREDDVPKDVPSYMGPQYDSFITHSPPFRSRSSSGSDYSCALPTTLLQSSPTCVVPIAPDFSTSLTLQGTPCNSSMTQYEDQRTSRDIPQQFPQITKEPAPLSLSHSPASSDRAPSTRQALKGSYSCEKCDKEFSQPQGLSRHRREIHEPKMCTLCGFKWGRRYLLRKHLEKKHPELNTDSALDGAATGYRGPSRGHRRLKVFNTPTASAFCN